jgi:hypothetical protein
MNVNGARWCPVARFSISGVSTREARNYTVTGWELRSDWVVHSKLGRSVYVKEHNGSGRTCHKVQICASQQSSTNKKNLVDRPGLNDA